MLELRSDYDATNCAMVLNDGNIAEMKTGEGKTLVGAIAVCFKCTKWKRCACC